MSSNTLVPIIICISEIILFGIPFCLYKIWGRNFLSTFIISCLLLNSTPFFIYNYPVLMLILDFVFLSEIIFFIYVCLLRTGNLSLLKNKSFLILLPLFYVYCVIALVFEKISKEIVPLLFFRFLICFKLIVLCPFYPENSKFWICIFIHSMWNFLCLFIPWKKTCVYFYIFTIFVLGICCIFVLGINKKKKL